MIFQEHLKSIPVFRLQNTKTVKPMLAEAHVDQTIIKKIVGHAGAMTLTEKVYTHLDVKELIDAINKI